MTSILVCPLSLFLHEIGHYVFYRINFIEKQGGDYDEEQLDKQYDNIPKQEEETFAHKYAESLKNKLESQGIIPFERIINKESMARDNLGLEWFVAD